MVWVVVVVVVGDGGDGGDGGGASVVDSTEKVEGPGTRGSKESSSVNDSTEENRPDVAATLSGLFAGLPTLAGPQRLANSLRQRFANNSGKS
ncbi:hypothetical protein M0802_006117 [Mischocyttarus mexicanus]|nr:hypothetical protein M0802_006117 [Mischocyttarus mexicanus]